MEGKATQAHTYEEFEPYCKWQRNENEDVLEIHLPEFKKEQLKVQISNSGILKIFGVRPLDAVRKSKFYTEIQISNNYDTSAIRAKLAKGKLYITMPKRKASVLEQDGKGSGEASSKAPPSSGDGVKEQKLTPEKKSSPMWRFPWRTVAAPSLRLPKVAVALAATAAAVAAVSLIAYVVYVYRSNVS